MRIRTKCMQDRRSSKKVHSRYTKILVLRGNAIRMARYRPLTRRTLVIRSRIRNRSRLITRQAHRTNTIRRKKPWEYPNEPYTHIKMKKHTT